MHNFRNPWWPLITTTVPVAILYYIFLEAVGLVAGQLSAAQLLAWRLAAVACMLLWSLHTGCVLWYGFRGQSLNRQYGLITIAAHALFLLILCCGSSAWIPENVQGSVLGEDRLCYAASCLSPTFLHGFLVVVLSGTQAGKPNGTSKFRCAAVVCLPVLVALICRDLSPPGGYVADTGLLLAFIALHYYAARWAFPVMTKRLLWRNGIGYGFRVTAVVAYPLSGVLVNNDILFDVVFHTFAYHGFYMFTLVNAVVICLPEPGQPHWRMLLFTLRVITFGFMLFMLTFYLPLLPQSAMALASFGLGYAMLAPVLLTIIKTRMILTDLSFLTFRFSTNAMIVLSLFAVFGSLVLGISVLRFKDNARAFASAVLHALAFYS